MGLHAGAERLTGPALPDPPSTGAASLLGAVGLDVSFPLDPSTVGVFVSVLDLGALLSLPLGEVSEATVSSDGDVRDARVDVTNPVNVSQVLSPGLYLRWGLPGLPLVLGAGASVVPSGRHVQELRGSSGAEDPVSEDVNVIRLTALLALDVTLFSL